MFQKIHVPKLSWKLLCKFYIFMLVLIVNVTKAELKKFLNIVCTKLHSPDQEITIELRWGFTKQKGPFYILKVKRYKEAEVYEKQYSSWLLTWVIRRQ